MAQHRVLVHFQHAEPAHLAQRIDLHELKVSPELQAAELPQISQRIQVGQGRVVMDSARSAVTPWRPSAEPSAPRSCSRSSASAVSWGKP